MFKSAQINLIVINIKQSIDNKITQPSQNNGKIFSLASEFSKMFPPVKIKLKVVNNSAISPRLTM